MYQIYIVEDDARMAGLVGRYLQKYGYAVQIADEFDSIKEEFVQYRPDLVILDIHLPSFDGFYWCRQIRSISHVPIIFLTARSGEMDQVFAIENGGDDYITKPFHLEVLLAKVKGVLRRTYGDYASPTDYHILEVDGLFLYRDKNTVEFNHRKTECSPKEFRLLDILLSKHGQVVTRNELLEAIWDEIDFVDDNTLNVNIRRVREKLKELGIVDAIQTIRGQGYLLKNTWGQSL
ncbi:putative transcriptional regulatory protein YvcP [Bacillus sp. J14TS2]|uniref:response regulator transcription factor n=1 Tax=Bacillus sp. J14TS2 TaxID=2807188 RepID=UPI001B04B53D|nr:response regulator transcription factor [Bacillus sp. J14TS2]GIN74739.1 putative transcriptional regulatory protein YvcP [Bacillus sp. J14TS2]